jgi:5-(carboxyamino)imidazole ribonucleotide mutase
MVIRAPALAAGMADPRVLVLLGGREDQDVAMETVKVLRRLDIPHSVHVASAHRSPERLRQLLKDSPAQVIIGLSGVAASLPGAVASLTMRPVIGVPVSPKMRVGSLFGGVQMPSGVPLATVGVDEGGNAALVAASILGLSDDAVQRAFAGYLEEQRALVAKQDEDLQAELGSL